MERERGGGGGKMRAPLPSGWLIIWLFRATDILYPYSLLSYPIKVHIRLVI